MDCWHKHGGDNFCVRYSISGRWNCQDAEDCEKFLEKGDGYRLQVGQRKAVATRLVVRLQVPERDMAAMGNMVDLLLDESKTPLWSTSPPTVALDALRQIWAGAKLMEELRTNRRSPDELFAFVRPQGNPIPFRNTDEDKQRFAELTKTLQRTPGLGRWLQWIAERLGK